MAATEVWGECEDTDRLVLAYSEIATNAVMHGAGPVTVAAQIDPTSAHCEIADRSARMPTIRHATTADLGGRGLEMVQLTVDRLRVAADEAGKTVSFEVGRHDDGQGNGDGRGNDDGWKQEQDGIPRQVGGRGQDQDQGGTRAEGRTTTLNGAGTDGVQDGLN